MPEAIETWQEAQARKVRERDQLEAERSVVGARVDALGARKQELVQAIKTGNRKRQDVGDARAELDRVKVDLSDAREQYAGVEADLQLIFDGPDGLQALLEQHRPELRELARQASEQAAEHLHDLGTVGRRFLDAYATAQRIHREASAIGPGHPGDREELGGARVPGGSPLDAVAVPLGDRPYIAGRSARAGHTWLDPVKALGLLLDALDGSDCLPACAVTDPRAGLEGAYRRVQDAQVELLHEQALRRADKHQQVLGGDDGLSAYRYERELTAGDRQALEMSRAEQADWDRGIPNKNPVGAMPGQPAAPAPDLGLGDDVVQLDQRAQPSEQVGTDDKLREWIPQRATDGAQW